MNSFRNWAANWGDIASVVGLLLTVLGFVVSIVSILRTKSVAEGVRSAVGQVSKQLAQKGAISDLASAISTMDELKRLQRSSAWAALPDRYSELRRKLVSIKSAGLPLTDAQHQALQGASETFADFERRIERALGGNKPIGNPAKFNEIVSVHIDEIYAVLLALQRSSEGVEDERS